MKITKKKVDNHSSSEKSDTDNEASDTVASDSEIERVTKKKINNVEKHVTKSLKKKRETSDSSNDEEDEKKLTSSSKPKSRKGKPVSKKGETSESSNDEEDEKKLTSSSKPKSRKGKPVSKKRETSESSNDEEDEKKLISSSKPKSRKGKPVSKKGETSESSNDEEDAKKLISSSKPKSKKGKPVYKKRETSELSNDEQEKEEDVKKSKTVPKSESKKAKPVYKKRETSESSNDEQEKEEDVNKSKTVSKSESRKSKPVSKKKTRKHSSSADTSEAQSNGSDEPTIRMKKVTKRRKVERHHTSEDESDSERDSFVKKSKSDIEREKKYSKNKHTRNAKTGKSVRKSASDSDSLSDEDTLRKKKIRRDNSVEENEKSNEKTSRVKKSERKSHGNDDDKQVLKKNEQKKARKSECEENRDMQIVSGANSSKRKPKQESLKKSGKKTVRNELWKNVPCVEYDENFLSDTPNLPSAMIGGIKQGFHQLGFVRNIKLLPTERKLKVTIKTDDKKNYYDIVYHNPVKLLLFLNVKGLSVSTYANNTTTKLENFEEMRFKHDTKLFAAPVECWGDDVSRELMTVTLENLLADYKTFQATSEKDVIKRSPTFAALRKKTPDTGTYETVKNFLFVQKQKIPGMTGLVSFKIDKDYTNVRNNNQNIDEKLCSLQTPVCTSWTKNKDIVLNLTTWDKMFPSADRHAAIVLSVKGFRLTNFGYTLLNKIECVYFESMKKYNPIVKVVFKIGHTEEECNEDDTPTETEKRVKSSRVDDQDSNAEDSDIVLEPNDLL
jgi:hypothetical protein